MSSPEEWIPMDRKTAESLLRGDRSSSPLAPILAAAKAPATERELAGESAAMAAFRAAGHSPASAAGRRRPSILASILTRLLTLKVAAVAVATSATVGGVALAASTGALPNPIAAGATPSLSATAGRSAHPKPSGSALPRPSASVSRTAGGLDRLCKEFIGRNPENRKQALTDDHFGELVQKAGGERDRVERFCGARPSSSPSTRPTRDRDGDERDGGARPPGNDNSSAEPRR